MTSSTLAAALLSWSLQAALLAGVGLVLPALFRLDPPALRLGYFRAVLLAVLALPFLPRLAPTGMLRFAEQLRVDGGAFVGAGNARAALDPAALLLAFLAAGALARLIWLGFGGWALRTRLRAATEAVLAPELAALAAEIGAPVARFLVSERVGSPVTFGWRRPVVLLPATFAALAPTAQRGIVLHELLHVRRRDWLFSLAEEGLRSLLWFHPGVRLLLSRIELAREQVVDAEVVRRTGARRPYLQALWSIASAPQAASIAGLPFMNRGHLHARVAQLTQEVSMSRRRAVLATTAFAALLAAIAAFAVTAFSVEGSPAAAALTASTHEPLRVGGKVTTPKKISGENPAYPETAKKDHAQGLAILQVIISEEGRIEKPRVLQSTGYPDLDQAGLDAISTWVFRPATLDGKPVKVHYTLKINFQSDEAKKEGASR